MEQKKLPNVTIAIILGILSFICCCFGGVPGLIVAGIAFILVRNDEKKYKSDPELYSNYSTLKTARIIAIIGMVIGLLYFLWTMYQINQMGGWEGYMEQSRELMEQWGIEE